MTLKVSLHDPIDNLKRGGEHVLVLLENSKGEILLAGKPQYSQGIVRVIIS
jgi:hypothetical protein